jgi:hypothetical protein
MAPHPGSCVRGSRPVPGPFQRRESGRAAPIPGARRSLPNPGPRVPSKGALPQPLPWPWPPRYHTTQFRPQASLLGPCGPCAHRCPGVRAKSDSQSPQLPGKPRAACTRAAMGRYLATPTHDAPGRAVAPQPARPGAMRGPYGTLAESTPTFRHLLCIRAMARHRISAAIISFERGGLTCGGHYSVLLAHSQDRGAKRAGRQVTWPRSKKTRNWSTGGGRSDRRLPV